MKRNISFGRILGILAVWVLLGCFWCEGAGAVKIEVQAFLSSVKGKVEVQRAGKAVWLIANDGMALRSGDTVRTGADGNCIVRWGKSNVVKLTPVSNVKLDRLEMDPASASSSSSLAIGGGKAFVQAKKQKGLSSSFDVKTPTAVAGVRGTTFSVGVKGGDSAGGGVGVGSGSGSSRGVGSGSGVGSGFGSGGAAGVASLASVKGTVEVKRAGGGDWVPGVSRMSLGIGDMVKTGKGGGCAVVFSGGSVMRVMALAVIRVEQPSSGGLSINVAAGKTFMKVKKGAGNQNFSVTTPTAVAGVRGTSFSVGVKGGKGAKTGMKAMLTRPKGTVEVQKAGSEVWVKAAEGMLLQSGDSVKTAGSGNCALVWGKGNVVKVSPMSLISVDRLESDPFSGAGNVALNVKAGSLKAKTGKQSAPGAGFEIRTPTAVAGVRGTTVSVETGEDGASDVQCSEGLLEVSAVGGGTVEVKSGEKTKVVKDADPAPPVAMTPEEALKIDGDEDLKDSALETAAPEEEKAPPAETQFECADGELEVTSEAGDVVPVTAGQKVAMVEEAPPAPPVQMSTEEMTNFTAEGNLEEIKVDEAKPGEASGNAGEPGTAGAAGAATATVSTPVETEIQCVDGEVSVKAEGGEEVAVKTGEKTSIAENSPAPVEPKKMTAQEMNSFTAAVSEMNAAVEAPVSQAAGDEKEKNKDKEKESETGAAKQAAPLSLSVSSPSDGLVTKNSSVTVSGSTSPNAEVTINDVPVSSGKASFTGNVSLIEGDNTLNVTAKEGDNSMTTTLTVTKDTTAPTLTMIQPGAQFDIDSGGCVYSDGSMVCDIIGLTEPQAKLSINNSGVTVEADGSFTKTLTMDLKATTIEISVEDAVGNRKSTTLTRTLNLTKVMELRISADPGSITADGKSVATITVRGYNVLQEPAAGETEVTITAEPAAGTLSANTIMLHNGVGTVTYTTDSTDPVVTITATTPSGLTAETTLSVTPDPAKVTDLSISADPGGIAADGKSVSTITIRGFNARQEPAAGETEVTITAEPAAGTLSANSILLHNGVGTVTFTAGSAETTVTITAATTSGLTTATTLSITPATPPVRPFDW